MAYFDGIKEGDYIWCIGIGFCDVYSVKENLVYFHHILGDVKRYGVCDFDGRLLNDDNTILPLQATFWDEIKIIPPPKPIQAPPIYTLVICWNDGMDDTKYIRASAGIIIDGLLSVFSYIGQGNGHICKGYFKYWEIFKLEQN